MPLHLGLLDFLSSVADPRSGEGGGPAGEANTHVKASSVDALGIEITHTAGALD